MKEAHDFQRLDPSTDRSSMALLGPDGIMADRDDLCAEYFWGGRA